MQNSNFKFKAFLMVVNRIFIECKLWMFLHNPNLKSRDVTYPDLTTVGKPNPLTQQILNNACYFKQHMIFKVKNLQKWAKSQEVQLQSQDTVSRVQNDTKTKSSKYVHTTLSVKEKKDIKVRIDEVWGLLWIRSSLRLEIL